MVKLRVNKKASKKTSKKKATKKPTVDKKKLAALEAVVKKVNKSLGKDGAVFLGSQHKTFTRMGTGIVALDFVIGGGLPRGQMTMFSGEDSTAKTMCSILSAAKVQREGGTVVWVAGEGFDREWAESHGVDLDSIFVIQADTGDVALESAISLMEEAPVDLLVIDSVQSLGTTREMEDGVDQESYGNAGAPQMWGRIMRRCYAAMNKMEQGQETAIIAISQVRSAVGKRGFRGMTPDPESSGIKALKHWKAVEVFFKKGDYDYEGDKEKRNITRRQFKLKNLKNKTATPHRESSFDFYPRTRKVDNRITAVRLAKAFGFVENKGAWYKGYGVRAQGERAFADKLDPSVLRKMVQEVNRQAAE